MDENGRETAPPGAGVNPERWVDDHGDALYRFALTHVRDASVAQDLVQEAFLAALRSRARFAGRSSERTWLISILKHKISDYLRRLYRERSAQWEEESSTGGLAAFDERRHWRVRDGYGPQEWGRNASSALEKKEFWIALEECLRTLSSRSAEAFVLREMDALSTEEICKALGVTATNLWVLLHRARTALRRCLEKSWFSPVVSGPSAGARR